MRALRSILLPALLPLLALACAEETPKRASNGVELSELDGIDYTLQIEMVLPTNEFDLLDEVTTVSLVVNNGDGTRIEAMTWDLLNEIETTPATQLPALTSAWLSLVATDASGATVAVGKVGPITATTGLIQLSVLMAAPNRFAWPPQLSENLHGSAVGSMGDGTFYVFGGSTKQPGTSAGGVDTVWRLNFTSSTATPTLAQVGQMPPFSESEDGRAGHTVTLLPSAAGAYAGWFLIAGGVPNFGGVDNAATTELALWNPADGSSIPLPNGSGGSQSLTNERFFHRALLTPSGRVYFVGGLQTSNPVDPVQAVELFDPASSAVERFSGSFTDFLGFGAAAAVLPDERLVVCGGMEGGRAGSDGYLADMKVSGQCNLLDPADLTVNAMEDLPSPAAHAAMLTLSDGSLLLSGGLPGVQDGEASYVPLTGDMPASNAVYRYKDGAWETAGALLIARSGHQMAELPDGRVLIWGGSSNPDDCFFGGKQSIAWAELYNPGAQTSTFVDPACAAAPESCDPSEDEGDLPQAVSFPAFAVDPSFGVLTVGGVDKDNSPSESLALFRFEELP
jgi:hypothetical protein